MRRASSIRSGLSQALKPSLGSSSLGWSALCRTQTRSFETDDRPNITIIPGDGIGTETVNSVIGIWHSMEVPIRWELFPTTSSTEDDYSGEEIINSIATTGTALKGVFLTRRTGPESLNVRIRKALQLYAGVCRIKNMDGVPARFPEPLDIAIIRENTEGEYSGVEHEASPGVAQSLKLITSESSLRIAEYAFEYAVSHGRKKVTAVHKANIQKLADGLFLECCRIVKDKYPTIEYEEMIVDNASMQMVMRPNQFDVVLTPNLYGAILTNLAAGLIGGSGVVPGFVAGPRNVKVFEPGARHVSLDIAGQNKANPTAMIKSSVKLLRHVGLGEYAEKINDATNHVLSKKKYHTEDLGGTASTTDVTKAIIDKLHKRKLH